METSIKEKVNDIPSFWTFFEHRRLEVRVGLLDLKHTAYTCILFGKQRKDRPELLSCCFVSKICAFHAVIKIFALPFFSAKELEWPTAEAFMKFDKSRECKAYGILIWWINSSAIYMTQSRWCFQFAISTLYHRAHKTEDIFINWYDQSFVISISKLRSSLTPLSFVRACNRCSSGAGERVESTLLQPGCLQNGLDDLLNFVYTEIWTSQWDKRFVPSLQVYHLYYKYFLVF